MLFALLGLPTLAHAQQLGPQPVIHKVKSSGDRLEMIVNSSRILTLDQKIPQAQVNNPDVLEITPLSATQVQVHAKKTGVTQINLWDEKNEIHTVDVIVFGDSQELAMVLESEFPNASLTVRPLSNSVIISGYVDDPNHVRSIIEIAENYHPNVINRITVGGVQQVLLQVKIMEVSRTKLRDMGFDFSTISGDDFLVSGVSGLLSATAGHGGATPAAPLGGGQGSGIAFGVVDGSNSFFGILQALQQRNVARTLAEPNLMTYSGRPAQFLSGGEFPIPIQAGLGNTSIQWRDFGVKVDFVPIVLGNGNIRLEVRPEVSERDDTIGVSTGGLIVPGLRTRRADTGVELRAGQTLALAGLVFERTSTQTRGLPWLSDLPWVGAAFRRNTDSTNEVELLIMVTPQLVEGMDPHEVPPCGPGESTESPGDVDLYWRGYTEVPKCGGACGIHGCSGDVGHDCQEAALPSGMEMLPPTEVIPTPPQAARAKKPAPSSSRNKTATRRLPSSQAQPSLAKPAQHNPLRPVSQTTSKPASSSRRAITVPPANKSAERQNRTAPAGGPSLRQANSSAEPGFAGPVGYDVLK